MSDEDATLRVMVWNVHGLRAGVGRVASVIKCHTPDLVLVNECGWRRQLDALGAEVGMSVVAGKMPPLRTPWARNAVLAGPWLLPEAYRVVRLTPDPPSLAWRPRATQPRGALLVKIVTPEAVMTVASVHLGLRPGERRDHTDLLLAAFDEVWTPVLVGGDLNERPDEKTVDRIARRFRDTWPAAAEAAPDARTEPGATRGDKPRAHIGKGLTYPSEAPQARIDYLFASEEFDVQRAKVIDDAGVRAASDHLPLVVDLRLSAGRD